MADHITKQYDAFISISDDLEDQKWVHKWLAPRLRKAGITFITSDELPGESYLVDDIANAISNSRYNLFILTPAWNETGFGAFEKALAQLEDAHGTKQHLIPVWLKDCPIPKTLKIYTKRDFRRKEGQNLQAQILIGRLLPSPTKLSDIPSTISAKFLTWIWEHPLRTSSITLILLLTISAMAGFPSVEGWQAISQENLGRSAKWITRVGETLFVTTSTNGGCNDPLDTGLWRSLDHGQHWERISIPLLDYQTSKGCDRAAIEAIVASPEKAQRLYAATSDVGLLISENNGTTWQVLNDDAPRKQLSALAVMTAPERLFVVGKVPTTFGLYRSMGGKEWERLDSPDLCKQNGYLSLPSTATVNGVILVVNDLLYVAPSDSGSVSGKPEGTDIYYSADSGNCWQRFHNTNTGVYYSALAALPNTRSEILFATWDGAGLGRKIWRRNWETGQEQLLGDSPLDTSQLFVESNEERWYASTPFALLFRGNVRQFESPTRLFGPFSLYASFTSDFEGGPPLLLSGGRVFRRGMVGWWQGLFP
jgi:hypothetical protein